MSILVTYAVAIVIEGILTAIFGVNYQQLSASYVNSSVHMLGFYLPDIYLIGFGMAVALLAGLYYMLYRTKFGRAVRASLQNRTAADLIGIQVDRVTDYFSRDRRRRDGRRWRGVRRHQLLQPEYRL